MKRNTRAKLMFYALIHTLMPRFGIKSKHKERYIPEQRTRVSTLKFKKHIDRAKTVQWREESQETLQKIRLDFRIKKSRVNSVIGLHL